MDQTTKAVLTQDKPWKCRCGFLLGMVNGSILRIKYKDLYLTVSGEDSTVTQLCRRCASPNTLSSTPEAEPQVPDVHKEAFKEAIQKPK